MYGPQGWWPILDENGLSVYDGKAPRNDNECFEICIGAILTQNTTWKNVEKALSALKKRALLDPQRLIDCDKLNKIIRPAGYFNQKSKKIKIFSDFYRALKGRMPSREDLLSLWGIGPETADSILLYAFEFPTFVVDAYTKRIMQNLNIMDEMWEYERIRDMFLSNLPKEVALFKEYHALLVRHAKEYYQRKPYNCPLGAEVKNG